MITISAKTLDEAITKALLELKTTTEHLHYEVVQKESSGFLGLFGGKSCIIRARVMGEDEEKEAKKQKKEKEKAEQAARAEAEKREKAAKAEAEKKERERKAEAERKEKEAKAEAEKKESSVKTEALKQEETSKNGRDHRGKIMSLGILTESGTESEKGEDQKDGSGVPVSREQNESQRSDRK